MNSDHLLGFKFEMEKQSGDLGETAKGVAIGALLGAGLSAVSTEILKKMIVNNQHLAILAGAMMGGSLMGSSSYLISNLKDQVAPPPPSVMPTSEMRVVI